MGASLRRRLLRRARARSTAATCSKRRRRSWFGFVDRRARRLRAHAEHAPIRSTGARATRGSRGALAWHLGDTLSFGGSLQGAFSGDALFNGLFGITLGASFRPDPHLGLSFVVAGSEPPEDDAAPERAAAARSQLHDGGRVPADGQARHRARRRRALPRGRRRAERRSVAPARDGRGRHPERRSRARRLRDLATSRTTRSGASSRARRSSSPSGTSRRAAARSSAAGSADTTSASSGRSRIRARASPGLPLPAHAVSIRIETTPGTRGHVALLRKLWRIADTRNVDAVVARAARRAGVVVRARRGARRRHPRAPRARQEGALPLRGQRREGALRLRERRSHRHEPGRRHPLRGPSLAVLLPRRAARQARHPRRVRAHRRAQERARAVHERARVARRRGRSRGLPPQRRGGLREEPRQRAPASPKTASAR